jgi:hypothetical protein
LNTRLLQLTAWEALLLVALLVALLAGLGAPPAHAQQTVLNVPSADVLDRGKTYMEWDATVGDTSPSAAVTPRSVNGLGHGVEAGINLSSLNLPHGGEVVMDPTVKWKFFESADRSLVLFGGEQVYLPFKRTTYRIGNYGYLEGAKTFRSGTRVGVGAYDFTAQVIDPANRGGVQASIEQTVNARLSLAVDWYSGDTSIGYKNVGGSWKLTNSLTLMGAYELGNRGVMQGNHSILLEFGWNPEFKHGGKA